jgi:BirA family biotin operon repressor/biotin-[acetyl-CoA-carboxylase] ligase
MEQLSAKKLRKLLPEKEVVFFKKTTSTFDHEGEVVVAMQQTKGRGRNNRSFFCGKGGIHLCITTSFAPRATISAAAGVMRAMENHGFSPKVKWVNDILLSGKKVCGILAKRNGNTITIGIGFNYSIRKFPLFLQNKAISMQKSSKGINAFAAEIVREVEKAIKSDDSLQFYSSRLAFVGEEVIISGKKAALLGIDKSGHLEYLSDGQKFTLVSGDIE